MNIEVDGQAREVASEPDTPLLWVLRDELGITAPKYGCGIALCGACTVLLDGEATRSCVLPAQAAEGRRVTTLRGLADDPSAQALVRAWIDRQVPQCGYCQSGFVVAATALLKRSPAPSDEEIDAQITNICRCGTYDAMREAIHQAAREAGGA